MRISSLKIKFELYKHYWHQIHWNITQTPMLSTLVKIETFCSNAKRMLKNWKEKSKSNVITKIHKQISTKPINLTEILNQIPH